MDNQTENLKWLNTADTHEQEYKWLSALLNQVNSDIAMFGFYNMNTIAHRGNNVIRVMKELCEKCETLDEFKELLNNMQHEVIKLDERNHKLAEKDPKWKR